MKSIIILAGIAGLAVAPVCLEHKLQKEITPGFCTAVTHTPAPGVTYEGGVDVKGKPVVEADLNPSPVKVPDTVTFNVTVDMAKYLGLQTTGVEGLATIGTVAYDKGVLTFNGEPMEGRPAAALRELCAMPPPPAKDAAKEPKKAH